MWIYSIKWSSPYTSPPGPSVLAWTDAAGHSPDAAEAVREAARAAGHVPGDGYSLHIDFPDTAPPRQLSGQSLAIARRRRLENMMRDRYPLFADQFIADELMHNDSAYDPQHCAAEQMSRREAWEAGNRAAMPSDKYVEPRQ